MINITLILLKDHYEDDSEVNFYDGYDLANIFFTIYIMNILVRMVSNIIVVITMTIIMITTSIQKMMKKWNYNDKNEDGDENYDDDEGDDDDNYKNDKCKWSYKKMAAMTIMIIFMTIFMIIIMITMVMIIMVGIMIMIIKSKTELLFYYL